MTVDNRETIIKKYTQNVRGIFAELLKMIKEARGRGHNILPDELIILGRDYTLNLDNQESMFKIAERSTPIIDFVRDKEIGYFQKSWTILIAGEENFIVKQLLSTKFDIEDTDGNIIYNRQSIDKIFSFIYSLYKVSLKMILDTSGVREKTINSDGTTLYVLENQVHQFFDSMTLSHLLAKHNVKDIP